MTIQKTNAENEVYEDERKFLLKNDSWKALVTKTEDIVQGYLSTDNDVIKVFKVNDTYLLRLDLENSKGPFVVERDLTENEFKQLNENLHKDKKVLRIRIKNGEYLFTIKIETDIVGRNIEVERSLTENEYFNMEEIALTFISKIRSLVPYEGHIFEIDVFRANNEGKSLAEVEMNDISDEIKLPDWIGEEVTHDPSYSNYNLSRNK